MATADRDEIISERKLQRCKDGIVRALGRLADGQVIAQPGTDAVTTSNPVDPNNPQQPVDPNKPKDELTLEDGTF